MTSFLLCIPDGVGEEHNGVQVYRNGLPIGIVRNGAFEIHHFRNCDGTKGPPVIIDPKWIATALEAVTLVRWSPEAKGTL